MYLVSFHYSTTAAAASATTTRGLGIVAEFVTSRSMGPATIRNKHSRDEGGECGERLQR
jgi:hypothetical protein